jgi:hypothetical protein
MPDQTPKFFNMGFRWTGFLRKTGGIGMGSQTVEFSSRSPERGTGVVNPIAALHLPTAKLAPARKRAGIPNHFLVTHNVKPVEVTLPYHHRV